MAACRQPPVGWRDGLTRGVAPCVDALFASSVVLTCQKPVAHSAGPSSSGTTCGAPRRLLITVRRNDALPPVTPKKPEQQHLTQVNAAEARSCERVAVDSTLTGPLEKFQQDIRRLLRDFDTVGGSSAGSVALRYCQDRMKSLQTLCGNASVACDQMLSELAQTAQSLERAQQEVIQKIPQLAPGRAEQILAQFGILFGLIASVAIFVAAPYLAPTAAAIAVAKGVAGGLLFASIFGHDWVERRDAARANLGDLKPALATIEAATLHARALHTIVSIRSQVTQQTRDFYGALLNPPLGHSVELAWHDPAALPQRRVSAALDKSPLCAALFGLNAGAISFASEAQRVEFCRRLNVEAAAAMAATTQSTTQSTALTQPPGVLAGDAAHHENRLAFAPLSALLTFRPPFMKYDWDRQAPQHYVSPKDMHEDETLRSRREMLDCNVRQHPDVIADAGARDFPTVRPPTREGMQFVRDMAVMHVSSGQKFLKSLAVSTPRLLQREAGDNARNPNVGVETRGTQPADEARPRNYFSAVWTKIGNWFPRTSQHAAWELLSHILSEAACVADRLTCLENLQQAALDAYKPKFNATADGDSRSFHLQDVFQVTLNEREETCKFQMQCPLPE